MEETNPKDWWLYRGTDSPHKVTFPDPPPWRDYSKCSQRESRGEKFQVSDAEKDVINAAIYLRRPLLVTGKPGTGKSTLAYSIAYELNLDPVLHWPITTRTTLKDGLYSYDAIGRLQDASLKVRSKGAIAPDIGDYIQLGPLGTAFLPSEKPRVLLIDEFDKSDIDLPNDLLNIFEEGEFIIPELRRHSKIQLEVPIMPFDAAGEDDRVKVTKGQVRCSNFPIIILTSNGERDFPPAFLRRCLRLRIEDPDINKLREIVKSRLGPQVLKEAEKLITDFSTRRQGGDLATDQLLSTIFLFSYATSLKKYSIKEKKMLEEMIQTYLNA